MDNMKIIIYFGIFLVLVAGVVFAHEHNVEEIRDLIDSEISCDNLSNEQLEAIGEYYMEQMHPGEAHEMMDKMMGGEGSESLKQMHIQMARRIYCNEDVGGMMGGGMMGMMPMMTNMMGGNMTGNNYQNPQNNSVYLNNSLGFQIFFYIIATLLVIILILVIILLINKLKNNAKQKGGNKRK